MRSQLQYDELNDINFPIERQFHVLKHFKCVDKDYLAYLKNDSEFTSEEISLHLNLRGSDFYDGFAPNPLILWQNLKKKIPSDKIEAYWINGKCEIEVEYSNSEFPNGIGEDHLVHINELPPGILDKVDTGDWESLRKLNYKATPKTTWTLQVILRKLENSPEVISIFPGIYAPQLPERKLQSEDDYAQSLGFWTTHVVLKT